MQSLGQLSGQSVEWLTIAGGTILEIATKARYYRQIRKSVDQFRGRLFQQLMANSHRFAGKFRSKRYCPANFQPLVFQNGVRTLAGVCCPAASHCGELGKIRCHHGNWIYARGQMPFERVPRADRCPAIGHPANHCIVLAIGYWPLE